MSLDAKKIADIIGANWQVIIYDELDSTNNEAKRMLLSAPCEHVILMARSQTAGRGRQGKSFFSPTDCGIYMSLVLKPTWGELGSITTLAALAVCLAVEKVAGVSCGIKWVNDIYLKGKKVCGILAENVGGSIILGIGINLTTVAGGFPAELLERAAALDVGVDKNKLAGTLINELNALFEEGDYIEQYKNRSVVLGRDIEIIVGDVSTYARAVDIDSCGGLVVEYDDGTFGTLHYGEISIKGDFNE